MIFATSTDTTALNEWVVYDNGVRVGRYMGHNAPFLAARHVNKLKGLS